MKEYSYRERDYAFGRAMVTLRSAIGLTQTRLGSHLGVSRYTVVSWEKGEKYPNADHLKDFIALALEQQAFPRGQEDEAVRALWRSAHQKVLLDEAWLEALLRQLRPTNPAYPAKKGQAGAGKSAVLNLPFQPTPFVGRDTELVEISKLLSDPACRLLTLLGPGGTGKTRLVLEVARAQTETYEGVVAFVELAATTAPNQIVAAIAEVLGLSLAGQSDPVDHLLEDLRGRQLLLILDNFEHLLEGASLVQDILQQAPEVNVLVTSRERLHLRAEWLFDVEGLSYPDVGAFKVVSPRDAAELSSYSAIQLFVQRILQVKPGLLLSEVDLRSIVCICQHVQGLPLAIELAAAVRTLPITEIERQIGSNLNALSTTLRDVPARHRSMRAVFDHSWNLLSKEEQALLSHLAVFRGGCTAEAAERVSGGALPALTALIDKSLLRQNVVTTRSFSTKGAPDAAEESRFVLLEPVREYALEKLDERGELEELRYAHASYYVTLAEGAAAKWDTSSVDHAIELLEREHDNLRAALGWARAGGDLTLGLHLAGSLWRFWRGGGYINEGRQWLGDLLEQPSNKGLDAMSARVRALHGAAWLASDQHDFEQARLLFQQSADLRQALGWDEGETNLLLNEARQARAEGQYGRALTLLEDALSRHRASGNRGSSGNAGTGLALYELALVLREQGNFVRATELYQECLEFHLAIGDSEGAMSAVLGLGDVARDQGDPVGNRKYSEPSLTFYRDLGIKWAVGFALNNIAQATYMEGDFTQARTLIDDSEALFRDLKDDGGLAEVLITKGQIQREQGQIAPAYGTLSEALQLAQRVGPRLLVAAALEGLSAVTIQLEQVTLAAQLLSAASALRVEMGAPTRPVDRPFVDQAVSTTQSTLGHEKFTVIWSEARELPLERLLGSKN